MCKVCKNSQGNKKHIAEEMMFGFHDKFEYEECSECGCLQLINIPQNLEKYYPSQYYSYSGEGEEYILDDSLKNRVKKFIKKKITLHYNNQVNFVGRLFALFVKDGFPWLRKGVVTFDSKILDIGCGAGYLLLNMKFNGFNHLQGADPFIEKDILYKSGVNILKRDVFEIEGKYDLIMMHHSFEHMDEPIEIMKRVFDLLNNKGYALINIPVADSFAWRHYSVNWVQLDAPRHLYLHTTKSMQILAKEAGFDFIDVMHNSTEFQFTGSELYLSGQSLHNGSLSFSANQIAEFKKQAALLNIEHDGDSAVFYLQKP